MNDDRARQICTGVLEMAGNLKHFIKQRKAAEQAMQDIAMAVEHSGTIEKMKTDIKNALAGYWKVRKEAALEALLELDLGNKSD